MNSIKLITAFILLFCLNVSYGQSEGETIKLKTHCKILKTEKLSDTIPDSKLEYLEPNILFIVNENKIDSVALKAIDYNEKKYPKSAKTYNNYIFYISKEVFNKSFEIVEPIEKKEKMSIGILTLPFKARPQDDFTFDTEFNLSTTLNWNFQQIYNASLNLQIGAGIGGVNLNSSNANGITDDMAQDISALSLFSGLMLEYKRVQAGIYIGVDQINNQKEYQWTSNGNIWFGFGIGYNVFKISLGEKKNQK